MEFGKSRRLVDLIEAFSDVGVYHLFGLLVDATVDRLDGIVTGTPRSKSIAIWLEFGLPFGFQREFGKHLCCSIEQRWDAYPTLFHGGVRFGNPDPPNRSCFQLTPQLLNQVHARLRRERFDAIDPGGLLALIVLCDPADRQAFC